MSAKKPIEQIRHPDQNQLSDEKTSLVVLVVQNWKKKHYYESFESTKNHRNTHKNSVVKILSLRKQTKTMSDFNLKLAKKYRTSIIVKD